MFQQLISEADLAVNQAIKRQDPRNYVMIRKCLNKLISCDGIYFSGHRIMGISFHDSALHVYIELGRFNFKEDRFAVLTFWLFYLEPCLEQRIHIIAHYVQKLPRNAFLSLKRNWTKIMKIGTSKTWSKTEEITQATLQFGPYSNQPK